MRRGTVIVGLAILAVFTVLIASSSWALTIGGAVRQPLDLSIEDLSKMQSVPVRLNEITRDKEYKGVFTYQGVPLKTLLQMADIRKEPKSVFPKPIDLAVVVRSKSGKSAVLSWGELFYKNQGEVVLAVSGAPMRPHHQNCGECHDKAFYQQTLDQLDRKIVYPKLVVANDFFTDRCLEEVVSVEVVDLKGQSEKKTMKKLFSPKFVVSNGKGRTLEIADLSGHRHVDGIAKEVGDGRGYHGLKRYSGVPLRDLLNKAEIGQEMEAVILVGAPDGYRTLFSYGEVFLKPEGERIVIADSVDGKPLDADGRFMLIPPDDLAADRDIKAVDKIEVLLLPPSKPAK